MKILITGIAGFIGFHLAKKLIENNIEVIGVDNFNDYYDVNLKRSRAKKLKDLDINSSLIIKEIDITKLDDLKKLFDENKINNVVHLAAQAGVRYSLINPFSYIQNNVTQGIQHQNLSVGKNIAEHCHPICRCLEISMFEGH